MASSIPLKELQNNIRILILDDEDNIGLPVKIKLNQVGYNCVHFTTDPDEAVRLLPNTNIFLVDQYLGGNVDGLEIVEQAKKEYGSRLDIMMYSGTVKEKMLAKAKLAGATAFLEKPLEFDLLALWIEETSKRIWLEKILDAIPDEILVIDIKDFGKIHYVNQAKKIRFEGNKPLEGDYCYKRFEKNGSGEERCKECVTMNAMNDPHSVRAYWAFEDWKGNKGVTDLHAVVLRDQDDEPCAIIETARDRTVREIMEKSFRKIENSSDLQERMDLFLDGFLDMGYDRVRFYQRQKIKNKACYQGIKSRGMQKGFNITRLCYDVKINIPSSLIEKEKKPLLFWVKSFSKANWQQSKVYTFLYKVDPEFVEENEILEKDHWIELPVIANNKIIAKVSIDPPKGKYVTSYDLEILNDYAALAGQAIANSQNLTQLKFNNSINEAIINMSKEIAKYTKEDKWLNHAVKKVCHLFDTASCSIFLFDEESGNLKREATYARDNKNNPVKVDYFEECCSPKRLEGSVYNSGKSTFKNNLHDVIKDQSPHRIKEALDIDAFRYYETVLGETPYNGMYAVLRDNKEKIGVMRVFNKRSRDFFGNHDFTSNEKKAFTALAGQIGVWYTNLKIVNELKQAQKYEKFVTNEYSHTLKNMLQPFVSFTQFLQDDPNNKSMWKLLRNEITRMKTTIQTMVKLVSNDEGGLKLKTESVNINKMLEEVIKPYEIYFEDKAIKIELILDESLTTVRIDKTLVHDAVANLLDNAFKYGYKGTKVIIQSRKIRKYFELSVADVGEKIDPEDYKKIFNEFYIGKRVYDKVSQIGLGLYYVKTVVEGHGGNVRVDPDFEEGAKFVIKLPLIYKD